MGEIFDFLIGRTSKRDKLNDYLKYQKKYKKEAMEEYESKNLDGWLNERAEMDLNPSDNVKKYKADLKRWFLRTKEVYNQNRTPFKEIFSSSERNEWKRKFEITNNDFPLIYYIKDSESMNNDIGVDVMEWGYEDYCPIYNELIQCPEPGDYVKSRLTVMRNENRRNFYKKSGRKRR